MVTVLLTACQKQDQAPQAHQGEPTADQQAQISPEQQALIDAIDKPVQDEKNTDVPEDVANAPVE